MTGYFQYFPTVEWNNTTVLNIAARTDITRRVRGNPKNFYPLNSTEGLRPDRVAQAYYGLPTYAWLVYISGEIVDPYYGWALDDDSFTSYIISKYGTTTEAYAKIHHWQLSWFTGADETISPAIYQALESTVQQYYSPIYGAGTNILAYQLRREDWIETTNMFVGINVGTLSGGNGYTLDERVQVHFGNTLLGNAQVTWSNSTYVIVQHVLGNVTGNSTCVLTGQTTNTSANIVGEQPPFYNINPDEQAFWAPVSCWDYERDINEQKRHVKLVDSRYSGAAGAELKALLQPNTTIVKVLPVLQTITNFANN